MNRVPFSRPKTQKQRGFTLIELTFAVVVFAILAVGLIMSLGAAVQSENENRDLDIARAEARNRMEQVLAWPDFNTVKGQFDGMGFAVTSLTPLAGSGQPGSITVTDSTSELLRATVRIEWHSVRGEQSYEISTLIANPKITIPINQSN